MSLNKIFSAALMIFVVLFYSCGEKENNIKPVDYNDPQVLKETAKKVIETEPSFSAKGNFINDTTMQIAAGIEVDKPEEFGIKFFLITKNNDNFTKYFETPLLEGSFNDCQVNKIKFPAIDHELVYYSSKTFFMGSGGGEVYSYVVDFECREVFGAHLESSSEGIYLYITENTVDPGIRNFFIGNFKRDFPGLKVTDKL